MARQNRGSKALKKSANADNAFQLSAEKRHEIRQGRLLLHHFFSVLRTALYHSSNNEAMIEPSKAFEEVLKWFLEKESGRGAIMVSQGMVFAGSLRVRVGARQQDMVRDLSKFLSRRHIGGINFLRLLDDEEIRHMATTLVGFAKPTAAKDGVEALAQTFEDAGLGNAVAPVAAVDMKAGGGFSDIVIKGDAGRAAQNFLKTHTIMSTMMSGNSALARSGLQRMVRNISDVKGEDADSMLGLSIIGATHDMSMRSMIVLLIALKIANQFGATRDTIAEIGDIVIELAIYDADVVEKAEEYGYELASISAMGSLNNKKDWRLGTLRHQLALADRYLPVPGSSRAAKRALPTTNRVGEIIRIACDYVDLTTPTQMADSEPLLEGAPLAPHEALFRMRDYMGDRYTPEMFAGLVESIGLVPVGTAIETADGRASIVIERTSDPMTFVARDVVTQREREAGFVRGPNQIVRVAIGADLLQDRSKTLLGDDYDKFQEMRQRVELMALGTV